jgi:2'-5' RNA ligase
MIRSFFAIDLPQSFVDEIKHLQTRLKDTGADVKWVRPESVHLTLKFLGNVTEETLELLSSAALRAAADHPPLNLTLSELGFFPNRSAARVIWVGLAGDVAGLGRLRKSVESAATKFGFPPEKRPFRPHLTLGRVRSTRGWADLLAEMSEIKPMDLQFTAREVTLFKSDLRPSGAVYTILKTLPLSGQKEA